MSLPKPLRLFLALQCILLATRLTQWAQRLAPPSDVEVVAAQDLVQALLRDEAMARGYRPTPFEEQVATLAAHYGFPVVMVGKGISAAPQRPGSC
jgi:hypothetical protein